VVLDTNVLISGIFFGGLPARILAGWTTGKFELVLSPDILDEYQRVGEELARRHPDLATALGPILALVTTHALLVAAPALPEVVSADPADDKFLAAAIASGTAVIVSGDHDLLRISGWRGVRVLTPRAFANEYLGAD
jgi:putative PIN family toxin of toxin-antitoxin system